MKEGKEDDPEAVYRWSKRLMKASNAVYGNEAEAARDHLQRMYDLVVLVGKKDKSTEEYRYLISAANYYHQEAEKLFAQAMAQSRQRKQAVLPTVSTGAVPSVNTYSPAVKEVPKSIRIFALKYANANAVLQTIRTLNDASPQDLRIAVDERTNRLIMSGRPDSLREMEALIERLDVRGPEASKDAEGNVFRAPGAAR
jgi:type II secretory pathway component GspD/PulD (secretin)